MLEIDGYIRWRKLVLFILLYIDFITIFPQLKFLV